MTSSLDPTGLTIEPKPQIVADLIAQYQAIYGNGINVDSNSPDGQRINIEAQAITDLLELLLDTYNTFAVATSYGVRLDQLLALNGIQRKQGTFTLAQVAVTVRLFLTLPGLDQSLVTPFTVKDNAGNQFQLLASHVFIVAGTVTLTFQAVNVGQVQTTANTITNIVTSILNVTGVNNPSVAADLIGVNEENDSQLKVRHDQSFSLASTGPSDSLEAALRNTPNIQDAFVIENNTAATVASIPPYTIWVITRGGINTQIANTIYAKKSPGTPMKGSTSQLVNRPNGTTFLAQWDQAISQSLFVKFSIIWRGPQVLSNTDIITALVAALPYFLGQNPSIGDIVTAMATIAPTAIVTINSTTQGVSTDGSSWASLVSPTDAQHYFVLSAGNVVIS